MKLRLKAHVAASLPSYLVPRGKDLNLLSKFSSDFMQWLKKQGLQDLLLKGIESVVVEDTGEILWDLEDYHQQQKSEKELRERRRQMDSGVSKLDPLPFEGLDCTVPSQAAKFKVTTCPFPESLIQDVMFRGDVLGLQKFKRWSTGVWFAGAEGYAAGHYVEDGDGVYNCWLDVRNPYVPPEQEFDDYYAAQDPKILDGYLARVKAAGFDAWVQIENITVFESVKIMNAETGELM